MTRKITGVMTLQAGGIGPHSQAELVVFPFVNASRIVLTRVHGVAGEARHFTCFNTRCLEHGRIFTAS
jgi:hypothetical protein